MHLNLQSKQQQTEVTERLRNLNGQLAAAHLQITLSPVDAEANLGPGPRAQSANCKRSWPQFQIHEKYFRN